MPRTNRGAPRRTLAAAVLIVIVGLALAACASSAGAPAGQDDNRQPAAGQPGASSAPDQAGAPTTGERGLAAPIEQRIIKTGEMTLEVADLVDALARVRAMAIDLGGYVGGSQAGSRDDSATLTLRIPAARFEDALTALRDLDAEVIAEATREEDVTGQVVDIQARIDNLRASEASYRELVARAERIEDVLAVQTRLDQVRGEIEQLDAQLEALSGQADLSTLNVTLVPRSAPVEAQAEGWDPGAELDRALASLVGMGQGLADGAIWFLVVWVPVLGVLTLLVLVALRGVRGVLGVRRRMPAPVSGPEGPAA